MGRDPGLHRFVVGHRRRSGGDGATIDQGVEPGDVVSEHRSGYPEAEDEGATTATVSRDGRIVAIFGLSLADDGRWLVNGGQGCASVTIN